MTFPWSVDPIDATIELLDTRGWTGRRLGWEGDELWSSRERYMKVKDGVDADWSYEQGAVTSVMARKSAEELEVLRRAGGLSAIGWKAAMDSIREGVTDNQVAAAIYEAVIAAGSERMAIQPIVTIGRYSGIPHSTFHRRVIGMGDAVLMEFGPCVNRYTTPSIRTAVVGYVPDDLWRRMYDACMEAVNLTIEGMKPGALGRELAEAASKPLFALPEEVFVDGNRGYGVGLGFEPTWGDGTGLQIATDEFSRCRTRNREFILEPGQVFHVRAMTRVIGRFGAGTSETVAVTHTGHEVLTQFPSGFVVR
jgi:Xaa-Pro dipeptidase